MSATVPALVRHCTAQGLPLKQDLPEVGTLHLWSVTTCQETDPTISKLHTQSPHQKLGLWALLSPDEQARGQRYVISKARRQFIETRGRLRLLLGSYLGRDPAGLEFVYSDNGKPTLATHSGGDVLQFNLSHSQGSILYAVSNNQAVGVDLEGFNPLISYLNIAQRICTPQEWAAFDLLLPTEKPAAFFKIWTRKEALVKLFGDRLYEKLSVLEVPAHANLGSYWVEAENQQIWLQDLALGEGFAGAIALPTAPQQIIHHEWHTDEEHL
jgi:4'-phosphopantetheinyl transferase